MGAARWWGLVSALWLGACPHSAAELPSGAQMSEMESLAHVKFPPGIHVRAWHTERGIDEYFEIKFEMQPAEWPGFLSSSPFAGEALDPKHRGDLGADHGEWDPGKRARLLAGQVGLPGAKFLNLGVDDSRPDVVVVYLSYFGT